MGQYHYVCNLTKREFLHAHRFDGGLKAWEQAAAPAGGTASALIYLLACPVPRGGGDFKPGEYMGRWHGDRIALVGDYAEPGDLPEDVFTPPGPFAESPSGWTDISEPVLAALQAEGVPDK